MILFYVRHGDPQYAPDTLTPLGARQAEAIGRRLAVYGVDRIYTSPKFRARETARPLCEILKKTPTVVEFASEGLAWERFAVLSDDGKKTNFPFNVRYIKKLFTSPEMVAMGHDWHKHPDLARFNYEQAWEDHCNDVDEWILSLGYEHIRGTGRFRFVGQKEDAEKRIALFAHQGFGSFFFAHLLDIPYPVYCTRFDICHSGLTTVEMQPIGEDLFIPMVLTLSNDGHLYRETIPSNYPKF